MAMAVPLIVGGAMVAGGAIGTGVSGALSKTDSHQDPDPYRKDYWYGGSRSAQDAYNAMVQQQAMAADQRAAPQLDYTQAQQARGLMAQSAQSYQDVLSGKTASVAELQRQQGQMQAAAQGYQQAASARGGGGNAILAQRQAQQQAASASLGGNRDAAMLRAQEQDAARGGLANVGNQLRAGDMAQQGQMADVSQRQMGLNDSRNATYRGAQAHAFDQQLGAGMAYDKQRIQSEQWAAEQNDKLTEAAKERKAAFFGSIMNMGGSIMGKGAGGGGK
jgi:hypothetical protein